MADKPIDARNHNALAAALGALGPGGMATISFEDYAHLFSPSGAEPTEDEEEGRRAMSRFAAEHGCEPDIDHDEKRVYFSKKSK